MAVHSLTQTIQTAAWNSSSPKTPSSHNHNSLPAHIRTLIVLKRRSRALLQRTKYPSDKKTFNKLCSILKAQLSKQRANDYSNHIASLSVKDGSLWKTTRKILKHKATAHLLKKQDGTWAINDSEKSEIFRQHLSSVFQPNANPLPPFNEDEVTQFLSIPLPVSLPPKCFSPNEVKTLIHKFPLGKSPGFDLLTAEIARKLPPKTIIHITHILNAIIRLSYVPIQWKFALIILFPKPNKPPDSPSSYRPISLLPFFSKLCEKLILKRIYPIIQVNNAIPNSQFGFREKHSTIHQIHRLADTISYSLEKKMYTSAVFLDVSQAFDKVWHPGLL